MNNKKGFRVNEETVEEIISLARQEQKELEDER